MTAGHFAAADTFTHAADWLGATPGAEDALFSPVSIGAVADAVEALREGRAIDVDALADAIGGPRAIAEALATFIEWRFSPPPAGALQ